MGLIPFSLLAVNGGVAQRALRRIFNVAILGVTLCAALWGFNEWRMHDARQEGPKVRQLIHGVGT